MKLTYLLLISCCVFLVACTDKQAAEAAIENMLDEIQVAVKAQDSQLLLSYFSANARIQFVADPALGGNMDMGVKDYGLLLELSWSLAAKYDYAVKGVNIVLASDNDQAIVTNMTYETVSMQGKVVLSTVTEQTLDVVFLDGSPLIEHLSGKITINNQ